MVGVWVLVAPTLARTASRMRRVGQISVIAAVTVLWLAGAAQFRYLGMQLTPLLQLAESGVLQSTDTVAAEPIGILSFRTQARIVDIGGLTDRDAWPLLRQADHYRLAETIAWVVSKGAGKLVLAAACGPQGSAYGHYCLVDAATANTVKPNRCDRTLVNTCAVPSK
jgi:hypothetical protein